MSSFYLLGKRAAWQDYTWFNSDLREGVKKDFQEIKKDPLKSKGTSEQKGRRYGAIAGAAIGIPAGAGMASSQISDAINAFRSGRKLKGVARAGAAGTSLLAGMLMPMVGGNIGARIGRSKEEK